MKLKLQKILLIIFSLFFISLFFIGCATTEKIYLKCNYEPVPVRPKKEDFTNYQLYLKKIFLYTYDLEALKNYCID